MHAWRNGGILADRIEEGDVLTIRKASRDDAPDAWDIRRASVLAACAGHYPETALSAWVEGAPTEKWAGIVERDFHVAIDAGRVVGTGMLTLVTGQVDAIFIRPSHMGRGIGREMLRHLEGIACDHGLASMRLDSTLNAVPFYRGCGWSGDAISTYRTSRGLELPCVPMSKSLAP